MVALVSTIPTSGTLTELVVLLILFDAGASALALANCLLPASPIRTSASPSPSVSTAISLPVP